LRDGKSIHTVSALLFQLVQTSPHLLRYECHGLAKQRQFMQTPTQEIPLTEIDQGVSYFPEVYDPSKRHIIQEITLYSRGLDSAHKVAKTIVVFLTQRQFSFH
jgi:cohesin loading factor subunit SCC2